MPGFFDYETWLWKKQVRHLHDQGKELVTMAASTAA